MTSARAGIVGDRFRFTAAQPPAGDGGNGANAVAMQQLLQRQTRLEQQLQELVARSGTLPSPQAAPSGPELREDNEEASPQQKVDRSKLRDFFD